MSRTVAKGSLTRLACRIAASAARNRSQNVADALRSSGRNLEDEWETIRRRQERAAKAIDRGWCLAARRVLSDGRFDRDAWLPAWEKHCRAMDEFLRPGPAGLNNTELHTELQEVSNEFNDVGWNKRWLWATTEHIVLEDIYLGRFQIRLRLDRIGSPATGGDDFEVVALDPNPAGSDSEVTHPHVSGGRLCPGDATAPLRLAVQQGRLADFFQLVRSVLRTYNPASPFVRLNEWDGVRCSDCGASVSSEETVYCEACEEDFCDECTSYCRSCEATRCGACLRECRGCGDGCCSCCLSACAACGATELCASCLKACADCGRKELCVDCLEHDLCASCRDEQVEEDDDVNEDEGTDERKATGADGKPAVEMPAGRAVAADAAVHPVGLAQAPVPVSCG